ncbi:MAG: hypothetical protein JXJ20_12480 [Anaerolineae bacterium]|nr:hypothetical protein [Anaerolineae bacterium]
MPPQTDLFTNDLRLALERAQQEAASRHGNYLDVEHMLLGLLSQLSGPAHDLFESHDVDTSALYDRVADSVGMERPTPAPVKDFSKWARAAMDRAAKEAATLGHPLINSGHLLLSLLDETDGAVYETLAETSLTPDAVRAYLREHPPQPASPAANVIRLTDRSRTASRARPSADDQPEVVLIPFRPARQKKQDQQRASRWGNWPWIIGGLALLVAYLFYALPGSSVATFALVLIGWVFSVTLHEFAHALVAYLGGDYTVKDKGYLSFNPLKYTHPMLSIGLPLLFLAMGGIGLPGGAVYIERHRLKNKWWGAAVSAAGPVANLLLALVLSIPFIFDLVDVRTVLGNLTLWSAVAFLVMLQVTAVIFNLLPVPPLDGYGIIEPFLDDRTRFQLRQIGGYSLMLIFVALWFFPPVANAFWGVVFDVCGDLSIPSWLINEGFLNFMFWRQPTQ